MPKQNDIDKAIEILKLDIRGEYKGGRRELEDTHKLAIKALEQGGEDRLRRQKMIEQTTGASHNHCFCLQNTIGRPLCCKCMGVLLPDGTIQMLEEIKGEIEEAK